MNDIGCFRSMPTLWSSSRRWRFVFSRPARSASSSAARFAESAAAIAVSAADRRSDSAASRSRASRCAASNWAPAWRAACRAAAASSFRPCKRAAHLNRSAKARLVRATRAARLRAAPPAGPPLPHRAGPAQFRFRCSAWVFVSVVWRLQLRPCMGALPAACRLPRRSPRPCAAFISLINISSQGSYTPLAARTSVTR